MSDAKPEGASGSSLNGPHTPEGIASGLVRIVLRATDNRQAEAPIAAAIRAAESSALEGAIRIVAHARKYYGEDIFSPDGTSPECGHAKWARNLLDGITSDIRTFALVLGAASRRADASGTAPQAPLGALAQARSQARSEGRAAALEAAEAFVREFRNRKNWRAGRQLLNGQHDRDDAIADGIRALLNQGRDEVAPSLAVEKKEQNR